MSTSTLPISTLGWSRLQKPVNMTSEVRSFRAPRWRAAAMIVVVLGLGAGTAFAAFASPHTELARRTLEAERTQNLSYVWLANQPPERFWQPALELMLPVTTGSPAPVSMGPDA